MSSISSHRDLIVWQKAMLLVEEIYKHTAHFPKSEAYRLTGQICRAVVSVPSNIAEGHTRSAIRDYMRFIAIARGSLMETETLLMLAQRLGYVQPTQVTSTFSLITEISKMLTVLHSRLGERSARG